MSEFLREHNLKLSISRFMESLFTSWTKEVRAEHDIFVEGNPIVLKAVAGTSWGMDKQTIITSYKAISRSLLNDAAQFRSNTQLRVLQTAQNNAL